MRLATTLSQLCLSSCVLSFPSNQGLSISTFQKVKRVVGIELCQEAVEDARANALTNGENLYVTQQADGL